MIRPLDDHDLTWVTCTLICSLPIMVLDCLVVVFIQIYCYYMNRYSNICSTMPTTVKLFSVCDFKFAVPLWRYRSDR